MNRMRVSLLGTIAVAVLTLSACGEEKASTSESATPPPAASETAASSSPAAAAPGAGGAATPPGAKLKVGEKAVVPYKSSTKSGTLGLTVTAIDRGTAADLAKFGEKAKGITPYFIRLRVENVGGTDLTNISPTVSAFGGDGGPTGVILTGDLTNCKRESPPTPFSTVGATYDTCILKGAREGSTVAGAEYSDGEGYLRSPITWRT